MHYYQFNIGDYRRDTQHLSPLEHGIYRLLLDQYYLTEKPINANAFRPLCIRSANEIETAMNILKEFFQEVSEGEFIHKGCDKVISKYKEKSEKARTSAKTRWDANAMRTHSEGNANHKPITNNQEPIKKIGRFAPPSVEDVRQYCTERMNKIDPQHFVDHYSSNGWKVGKNQMKDWQAAVRTWEKRHETNKRSGKISNAEHRKNIGDFIEAQARAAVERLSEGSIPENEGNLPAEVGRSIFK